MFSRSEKTICTPETVGLVTMLNLGDMGQLDNETGFKSRPKIQ